MKANVRYYTQVAVLIALCIVMRRLGPPQSIPALNMGAWPILLAGFLMGPIVGAAVGGVSDVLGVLLSSSQHPYTFLLTLTAALTGVIPAAMILLFTPEQRKQWRAVGSSIAVGMLITQVWLVPCFQNLAFGLNIHAAIVHGLATQALLIPLYTVLTVPLLKALRTHHVTPWIDTMPAPERLAS